jgi:hypothetical protein
MIKVTQTKSKNYVIEIGEFAWDEYHAAMLNMTLRKYRNKLISYGAHRPIKGGDVIFTKEEDARKAAEEFIEPILLLKKITGEIM